MTQTQKERICEILEHDGEISNFWCIDSRLTIRLAMHIGVLRKAGWEIKTEIQDNKDCVYRLISMPAPRQLVL